MRAGCRATPAHYGDKLVSFSDALDHAAAAPDLQALAGAMLVETRAMQERAQRLEVGLGQSAQQIEELRIDLAKAQRDANTDSLTGIANRKYFDYELGAAAEEARLKHQPLSLLLADIDQFKRFNDTHGHQVGDQVLRLVAQVLTSSVKGRDLPARYGGEEFAVLLPQTDLEGAHQLAEQIRRTVADNHIRAKSSQPRSRPPHAVDRLRAVRPERGPERPDPARRRSPLRGQAPGPQPRRRGVADAGSRVGRLA